MVRGVQKLEVIIRLFLSLLLSFESVALGGIITS